MENLVSIIIISCFTFILSFILYGCIIMIYRKRCINIKQRDKSIKPKENELIIEMHSIHYIVSKEAEQNKDNNIDKV